MAAHGIDEAPLHKSRRHFSRPCLDWSERQDHLAGALGAALTHRLFEREWVKRVSGTRAVHLTDAGRDGLKREWGVKID